MLTNRAVILVISLLVCGYGQAFAAPAPLPPVAGVRIESLTHTARSVLKIGDRLTVTLRGSAGGSATFHIFGVATDVGMREVRTGVYQAQAALYTGTYVVRAGDAARNAAVSATLTVRGTEAAAFSARAVSIDTIPPVVTSRRPAPDTTVANTRPNIVLGLYDRETTVDRGTIRLFVNRQNVTARAAISEGAISYTPDAPFPPGPVRVEVVAADGARNVARAGWLFRVTANDLIHSVTITPTSPLRRGDLLTVVMTGLPGGTASFAIEGIPGGLPMRERSPGLYLGSYAAGPDAVIEAPLLVTIEHQGKRGIARAATGVSILLGPPRVPTIDSPGRAIVLGQEVVARLIVRGKAQSGTRVLGRIVFEGRGAEDQETLGEFVALTGSDSTWQAAVGPFAIPEGRLVLTVIAVDPTGQRSPPATLTIGP